MKDITRFVTKDVKIFFMKKKSASAIVTLQDSDDIDKRSGVDQEKERAIELDEEITASASSTSPNAPNISFEDSERYANLEEYVVFLSNKPEGEGSKERGILSCHGDISQEQAFKVTNALVNYLKSLPEDSAVNQIISVGSRGSRPPIETLIFEGMTFDNPEANFTMLCCGSEASGNERKRGTSMMHHKKVKFPNANEEVIPKDCKNVILFAGYPQGYLGSLLKLYVSRGGNRLITTNVSYSELTQGLMDGAHDGYEPEHQDSVPKMTALQCYIIQLNKKYKERISINLSNLPSSYNLPTGSEMSFYGNFDHEKLRNCYNESSKKRNNGFDDPDQSELLVDRKMISLYHLQLESELSKYREKMERAHQERLAKIKAEEEVSAAAVEPLPAPQPLSSAPIVSEKMNVLGH